MQATQTEYLESDHAVSSRSSVSPYSTLDGRQTIRLLRLLPGSTLKFALFPVDIHKSPPYFALSYTWGPHTDQGVITVNNQPITVPKNLVDALKCVRNYVWKNYLMLWADSACINQADMQERSHQVGLMHAIYRCAECVGIWLGNPAADSDLVMDRMKEWKCEFDRISEPFGVDSELALNSLSTSNTTFYRYTQNLAWRAFQNLIQRAWWGRAWIVQEATALGPSRTLLFCGSRMVDWSTFSVAYDIGHRAAYLEGPSISIKRTPQGLFAGRLATLRNDRESGHYIVLFTVLELIRVYDCHDPRDKLYASLGLAADVSETDIKPDYTKPVEDVYIDIAQFFLSKSELYCLDFLSLVVQSPKESGGTLSDLPSWIPDLRIRSSMYAFQRHLKFDGFGGRRAYNAAGNVRGFATIEGYSLRVYGFVLDLIENVYPVCHHDIATGGLSIERQWRTQVGMEGYPLGGTTMEAFNHTLMADIGMSVVNSEAHIRGMKVDWDILDQDPINLTAEEKQRRNWMLMDIKRTSFGRRLIQTREGLIGLGPGSAEIGDLVCVLFGGHVLYVLRKEQSDHYKFVGECYVHGMMDGEAINSSNTRREFIIV